MSDVPRHVRAKVVKDAQGMCEFCGMAEREHRQKRRDSGGLHAHHIWPDRHGGNEVKRNLVALCDGCHAKIEAKTRRLIQTNRWTEDIARARVRYLVEKHRRKEYPSGISGKMAALYSLRAKLRRNGVSPTADVFTDPP